MTLRVETSQLIGRPVEEVFEAWVDPQKMSGYFISSGSARMEAGRTVVWSWDDHGGAQLDIDVKTVEPGRELAFDWSASGVVSHVAVEFQPETEGTTRIAVRDGDWESDAEGIRRYESAGVADDESRDELEEGWHGALGEHLEEAYRREVGRARSKSPRNSGGE